MPISFFRIQQRGYAYAELGGHVLDVTGKRFASASHSVFNETSCSVTLRLHGPDV
jgi:hypothetical protein